MSDDVSRAARGRGGDADVDPVTLELVNNRLGEAIQEMEEAIYRTGYSTIIRESRDTSAGVVTADGRVVGQRALHNAIHLGVFPEAIRAVHRYHDDVVPGDAFLVNDPYIGGSAHSPDFIVVTPVFREEELVAFTVNVAHKPDIGGLVPGTSSGAARSLYHEGIQLPPVHLEEAGEPCTDIENVLRNNSRIPEVTLGDLRGQLGCTKVGKRKLEEVFDDFGTETVLACFDRLVDSAAERLRERLADWPETTGQAEAFLDAPRDAEEWSPDLAADERVRLACTVEHTGGGLVFDFTDSDDQTDLPINLRPPLVRALCYYGVVGMVDRTLPINSGVGDVVEVRTRPGSVLDPRRPAPVSSYVYPVNELVNVILRALSAFDPDTAVADAAGNFGYSFGTSGADADVQYEIVYAAYGGSSRGDGATGTSTHAMNVRITPIEILESEFPTRVEEFTVRPDSEGAGAHRGGFGLRRSYVVETDQQFTYRPKVSNVFAPRGVAGGQSPADPARCMVHHDGEVTRLPTIADPRHLDAGDRVVMDLPGGGGYGDPSERDPAAVGQDLRDGFLTVERAREVYDVDPDDVDVDTGVVEDSSLDTDDDL